MIEAAAGGGAGDSRTPLTVEELWALWRVGAPSLSPDGRRAVVSVTTADVETDERTADLWLLSTEGGPEGGDPGAPGRLLGPASRVPGTPPRRLTTHKARDTSPRWSPDGSQIAFLSQREGDEEKQIYLIAPDGGEARRLTEIPTGASAIKWFPDGRRIAFVSWVWPDLQTEEEQAVRLKERREAKVQAFAVETTSFRYWDHWLADGREPHLFVVDVATGECTDLLAGTGLSLYRYSTETDLSPDVYDIAPDGAEIALTVDTGEDPGFDTNADIVLLSIAGGGEPPGPTGTLRNLTAENPASDTTPRYSPDGRRLAYRRQRIPYFYADRQRLVVYDRRSGESRVLTEAWDRSAGTPHWSADGELLYFAAEDAARQPVWSIPVTGGEPRRVVDGGTNDGLEVSRDGGTLAFLRQTMDEPPRLHAAAADGSDARPVESFNVDRIARWHLGEVKEVTFPGWGGEPVQMWVIYPPNFDPALKWPLLQIVHGGPHGAWLDQFHLRWNMHLFASRGYVVAAVNFHGSTGWGEAFTDANTAQYGTKEFADVEAATDWLLAQGYIDPERLAAAGGSYGGYMVAWMNGHTDRYRAYVCHAGVYDWISQMASDAVRGRERALGAFPWDEPMRVLEQSAHWYAGRFRTPTLVIHGERDYRVPVAQGFEYYMTLRMRRVPARLLYFPDENHWILKPQNSRLWYREFFDWIGRYAPPGPAPGSPPGPVQDALFDAGR